MTRKLYKTDWDVLLVLFVLFLLLNSSIYSDELKISTPKSRIQIYEPLFLNVSGPSKKHSIDNMKIVVNGKKLGQDIQKLGLIHSKDEKVYGLLTILSEKEDPHSYVFDSKGEYNVSICGKTGRISNEIDITVKGCKNEQCRKASTSFFKTKLITKFKGYDSKISGNKEEIRRLEKLTKNYSNTIYATYSKYIIYMAKTSTHGMITDSLKVQDLATMGKLSKKYETFLKNEIPKPSLWHGLAMKRLVESKIWSHYLIKKKYGTVKQAAQILSKLKKIYTNTKIGDYAKRRYKLTQDKETIQSQVERYRDLRKEYEKWNDSRNINKENR